MSGPPEKEVEQFDFFEEKDNEKPRHLRISDNAWDQYDMTKPEVYEENYEGIVIIVSGDPKVGKTHFCMSACEFEGYSGEIYDLPPGTPMYYIDTELNAKAEYKRYYKGKKVHVATIYFEDDMTLETDAERSFETVKELVYSLRGKRGVVVIDSFSDFCDWLDEETVGKKKEEGTFKPFDYAEKKKEAKNFLRKMKAMGMIVIYTTQLKPKYESTGPGVWDFIQTGDKKIVATKGTEYWGDILVRIEKRIEDGVIKRKSIVMGSRFEDETVRIKENVSSNEFVDVIEKIKPYI